MTEQSTTKRGRPKSAPTRMTTVNIPAHYHAKAPEIVAQIQSWFDAVDIQSLVDAALQYTVQQAASGNYKPYQFKVASSELQAHSRVAARTQAGGDAQTAKNLMSAYKFSFRLPQSLYDRIQETADQLSTKPSDIIRIAISGAYIDDVEMIKRGDQPEFKMSPEQISEMRERTKNKPK